jgi:hypothetical protein
VNPKTHNLEAWDEWRRVEPKLREALGLAERGVLVTAAAWYYDAAGKQDRLRRAIEERQRANRAYDEAYDRAHAC